MKLEMLVGIGRKIGLFTLPFLVAGIPLNIIFPDFFRVNDTFGLLFKISLFLLFIGVVNWTWSIYLILTKIPRGQLITTGPYAMVKHPLYAGVALLILPWAGILLNTWLGFVIGLALYIGSRLYSPGEEQELSKIFGKEWEEYCKTVILPWV